MWHIFFIVNIVKIASWNVNSVRSRIGNILDWIKLEKPDILCLQETKVVDNDFPLSPFEEIGYNVKIHGQKSYNGVATLSKFLVEETFQGIPNYDDDQARYIETVHSSDLGMIRISNIYLPNGNPAPGPKYDYKLNWMKKLKNHLSETLLNEEIFIVLGDFNVIPGDRDCYDPLGWEGDALTRPETRKAFRRLAYSGYCDALRARHPDDVIYTYWDYQAGAWQRDNGVRIDHLMLSPEATDRLVEVGVDKAPRGLEKPSDHTPIWCELDI